MMMNTGAKSIISKNNLLTTVAWKIGEQVSYALEGSIFMGGAVVQWLRDGLGIIKSSTEVEALARSVKNTEGVYLVPAFSGLGAPHWNPHARGTIFGVTRGTNAAHYARAALDSIAYQTMDVLKAMDADAGIVIPELRVDGGATGNNLLMQSQLDILGVDVVRPKVTETTALGAAYLAGLAVGYWGSADDVQGQLAQRFKPALLADEVQANIKGWQWSVNLLGQAYLATLPRRCLAEWSAPSCWCIVC